MEYRIFCLSDATEEELRLWAEELDEEKKLRLERLRRPEDRLRSLCADHLARQMLSEALNTPRGQLRFSKDPMGKPYLLGTSDIHFNLSHAGNYTACAIDIHPVGVDIEVPRSVRPELSNKVCTEAEIPYIYPNGDFSPQRFLALWTAKEAYFKHSGEGLRQDLRSVCLVHEDSLSFPIPLQGLFRSEKEFFLSIAYE